MEWKKGIIECEKFGLFRRCLATSGTAAMPVEKIAVVIFVCKEEDGEYTNVDCRRVERNVAKKSAFLVTGLCISSSTTTQRCHGLFPYPVARCLLVMMKVVMFRYRFMQVYLLVCDVPTSPFHCTRQCNSGLVLEDFFCSAVPLVLM